jgi:hypothetical protein
MLVSALVLSLATGLQISADAVDSKRSRLLSPIAVAAVTGTLLYFAPGLLPRASGSSSSGARRAARRQASNQRNVRPCTLDD